MSFALDAAIAIRKEVRERLDGEMTSDLAHLICVAEHAVAALSPTEISAYCAWAWSSLTTEQRAETMRICHRGDA